MHQDRILAGWLSAQNRALSNSFSVLRWRWSFLHYEPSVEKWTLLQTFQHCCEKQSLESVNPVRNGARVRGTVQSWSRTDCSYIHQQIKLRIISNGRRSVGQNQKSARKGMSGCNINNGCNFYRAALYERGIGDRNSVRPSVCLSNERNFCPNSYTIWWRIDASSFSTEI